MSSRESRLNRRRCYTCDSGGDLHPCNGCGKVFHADVSCCGRRIATHRTGGLVTESGSPLLCGECFKQKCPCCSQSFPNTIEVLGCHEKYGGCGRIFHPGCIEDDYLPDTDPSSPSQADNWKCPDCQEEIHSLENRKPSSANRRSSRETNDSVRKIMTHESKKEHEEGDHHSDDSDEGGGIPSDESDDWDDSCGHCGKSHGTLLLCDGCPGAYHVECVGLSKMPSSDLKWYCPNCIQIRHLSEKRTSLKKKEKDGSGSSAVNTEIDDRIDGELVSTSLSEKQSTEENMVDYWDEDCAVCSRGGDLLCCDGCPRSFHIGCLRNAPNLDEDIWLCSDCQTHECYACASADPAITITNHIICGADDGDDEEVEGGEELLMQQQLGQGEGSGLTDGDSLGAYYDGVKKKSSKSNQKNRAKNRSKRNKKKKSEEKEEEEVELGCSKMFHLSCVGLSELPQGDWFCQECILFEPNIYEISQLRKERKERNKKLIQMMLQGNSNSQENEENKNNQRHYHATTASTSSQELLSTKIASKHERKHRQLRRHYSHQQGKGKSFGGGGSGKLKGSEAVWMARDLEDDGSSLWCRVDILDSPSDFASSDTVSVLYRGGELEGRFAIIPKEVSSSQCAVNQGQFLCHSSDDRWTWHRVKPRECGLWHRTPTMAHRVELSKLNNPAPPPLTSSKSILDISLSNSSQLRKHETSTKSAIPAAEVAVLDPRNMNSMRQAAEQVKEHRKGVSTERKMKEACSRLEELEKERCYLKQLHPRRILNNLPDNYDGSRIAKREIRGAKDSSFAVEYEEDDEMVLNGLVGGNRQGALKSQRRSEVDKLASITWDNQSHSQKTSNTKTNASLSEADLIPTVASLRLISYSLKERHGSSGAVPDSDLCFDVRCLDHPCLQLPEPEKEEMIHTSTEATSANDTHADANEGLWHVASGDQSSKNDVSIIPATKRQKKTDDGEICSDDEEIRGNKREKGNSEIVKQKTEEEKEEEEEEREEREGREEEEGQKQELDSGRPWWWSITGHDRRVLKSIANDKKFYDMVRILDAALFRMAFEHEHANYESHIARHVEEHYDKSMIFSNELDTDEEDELGDTLVSQRTGDGGSGKRGGEKGRKLMMHTGFGSDCYSDNRPGLRPKRLAAVQGQQHGYNEKQLEKQNSYYDASSQHIEATTSNASMRLSNTSLFNSATEQSTGANSSSSSSNLVITVAFCCYEGKIRSVACVELIAKLFQIRHENLIKTNKLMLEEKQKEIERTNSKSEKKRKLDDKVTVGKEYTDIKKREENKFIDEENAEEVLDGDELVLRDILYSRAGQGIVKGPKSVEDIQKYHMEIFDTLNCNSLNNAPFPKTRSEQNNSSSNLDTSSFVQGDISTSSNHIERMTDEGIDDDFDEGSLLERCDGYLWMSWNDAWMMLRSLGWNRYHGNGIDTNTYYVAPNISRVKGVPVGIRGKDYFTKTDAVITYAQQLSHQNP